MGGVKSVALNLDGKPVQIPVDLLTLAEIEAATGIGIVEVNNRIAMWGGEDKSADLAKVQISLLLQIITGMVRRVQPGATREAVVAKIGAITLRQLTAVVVPCLDATMSALFGDVDEDAAAERPTEAATPHGDGQLLNAESNQVKPGG